MCRWMGQKGFGYEIGLLLTTIIIREIDKYYRNAHKKTNFFLQQV